MGYFPVLLAAGKLENGAIALGVYVGAKAMVWPWRTSDMPDTHWLTVEQVCEYVQLSKKAVYDLTHRQKIPFTKIGRRLRFNRREIDAWLMENTTAVRR